jgi:hypothetical protein
MSFFSWVSIKGQLLPAFVRFVVEDEKENISDTHADITIFITKEEEEQIKSGVNIDEIVNELILSMREE